LWGKKTVPVRERRGGIGVFRYTGLRENRATEKGFWYKGRSVGEKETNNKIPKGKKEKRGSAIA